MLSGVPQGSVLGPFIFLIFVNNLSDIINFTVRLFADDFILYLDIRRSEDQQILQNDLNKIATWEEVWLLIFNVAKCHSLRVTRITQLYFYVHFSPPHPPGSISMKIYTHSVLRHLS